jgi:hypothetical protein
LVARDAEVHDGVRVLLDTKGALWFGAAVGAVLGLVWMMLGLGSRSCRRG